MTHRSSPRSVLSTSRGRGLVALLVAAGLAACNVKTKTPGAAPGVEDGASTTGDPTTSAGGSTGTTPSPAWTCSGDAAYRATSTAFTSPTAPRLASVLNQLVYAYEARPLAIVLRQQGYSRLGAASATSAQGEAMVFSAPAPPLLALDETAQGFGNLTPQPSGVLTLVDAQGPVTIALEEIRWRARPDDGCGSIWVSFDAIIPASEGATTLHLGGGSASIATLAASADGAYGYPVHAWFLGESTDFDFTSLPPSP